MTKVIQTRQQHYDIAKKAHDEAVAANRKLPRAQRAPLPDLPEPPIVAGPGVASTDLNHDDVRYYDSNTGQVTGWRKASEKDQLDADWEEMLLG